MRRPIDCAREQDVLDALGSARWPERCDDDLRAHARACAVCRDLLDVAEPLLALRDDAWITVRVPAPGTVWWRAQLRARREAARKAARPIGIAQAVAAVCAVLIAAAGCWLASPWLTAGSEWLASWASAATALVSVDLPRVSLPDAAALAKWRWVAVLLGLSLVLAPLAFYLALGDGDS